MMKAKAYAAGTIINALALGYGCAFGLDLVTKVKLTVEDDLKDSLLIEDGLEKRSEVVDHVLSHFGLRGVVEVKSEIPKGSGLGSSSAFVNALLLCIFKYLGKRLFAHEILRLNARMSRDLGISYTGAFDDASASLLGGIVLTDNTNMRLISWEFKRAEAIVLIPNWKRGKIDLNEIRRDPKLVKEALECAKKGDYRRAMLLNSKHYCKRIGYPFDVVERASRVGCCCGLSGNGPTFVAFGEHLEAVEKIWKRYGRVIWTEIVNKASDDVIVVEEIYGNSDRK